MNDGLHEQYLTNLISCSWAIQHVLESELSWGDISIRQIVVLRQLMDGRNHHITELSTRINMSRRETSLLIRQLQNLEYVKRTSDIIVCTELGQQMLQVVLQRFRQIATALLDEYPREILVDHVAFYNLLKQKCFNTDFYKK